MIIEFAIIPFSGNAGEYLNINFMDGSVQYFDTALKQAFDYVLVDNIGEGQIRVMHNRLYDDLINPAVGAKTLKASDSIYIEEEVKSLRIYFIESSTIELVLKTA